MAKKKLAKYIVEFFLSSKYHKLARVTQILSGEGVEMPRNTMPLSFPP